MEHFHSSEAREKDMTGSTVRKPYETGAIDAVIVVIYVVFRLSRTLSGLGGPKNFIY